MGIVAMTLLVADLDRPFHGFMVVKLDCVVDVIRLLDDTCLRHSGSTIGIEKTSILTSVAVPPVSDESHQVYDDGDQVEPDAMSLTSQDAHSTHGVRSFRHRSFRSHFQRTSPSTNYRVRTSASDSHQSGQLSPQMQQRILAMGRLRAKNRPKLQSTSGDINDGLEPVDPSAGTASADAGNGLPIRYDDLDAIEEALTSEASRMGGAPSRNGTILPP
jgi:hypothetical protein